MAKCPDITLNYLWELIEGKNNDEWCDQVPIWVLRDAFELLLREPVKIEVKKINDSGRCGRCPNCLIELNETDYPNYCGHCGQAVKWDG